MTDHFNKLTPAQAERLAMLAEECGEVMQVIGKILRHGYDSYHPDTGEGNRALLVKEMTDLMAVHAAMIASGDTRYPTQEEAGAAWKKKLRYAHHQR